MPDPTKSEPNTAAEGWRAETVYISLERKGISHYAVRGGGDLVATHIPSEDLARRISANPELLLLAEAVAAAYSEGGEFNALTSEYSTADLRELARAALDKAAGRAVARKTVRVYVPRPWEDGTHSLVTAQLYLREEIEAYEGDPAEAPGSLNSYDAERERRGEQAPDAAVLLGLLTGACTHYFIHSPDAERARDYAGDNFNVGDLASELGSADLGRALRLHGIASLDLENRYERYDDWVYDTTLVTEEAFAEEDEGDDDEGEGKDEQ
jgi:hypothetical protein